VLCSIVKLQTCLTFTGFVVVSVNSRSVEAFLSQIVLPSDQGLRCPGLTAPWIIPGAMVRVVFNICIERPLAPTVSPGDVVILDNLKVHDSAKDKAVLAERAAWFLFLPPYSPDLNSIEMAFAKLKAHLRAAVNISALFEPKECWKFFRHAGYVST
jgi:hypothetical protein